MTQLCSNCKRKWFVGLFVFFLDNYLQKRCGQIALWHTKPCFSQSIWSSLFDVNQLFLRNVGWGSQKLTFARRQWAQYLLFLFFTQQLFQSIWAIMFDNNLFLKKAIMFDNNQSFSQKRSPMVSKANFCSKTVGTGFAVFALHSTSFPINLIFIVWCQSIIFSEMEPGTLKSELLLEDSGHSICCFCSSLNIFSNQFDPNQFD